MQAIFLEFKHENGALAANGTDTTFYIDGRWSWATTKRKIHERIEALRSGPAKGRYTKQQFVGFTYAGGREGAIHSMSDPKPPAWIPHTHTHGPESYSYTGAGGGGYYVGVCGICGHRAEPQFTG